MTIPQTSYLLSLARDIHQLTANLVEELYSLQPNEPDFTPSSAEVPTSPAYNTIRSKLNDVATDLLHLINGPKLHLQRYIFSHNDLAAYQVAFEFNIFSAVPEGDSIDLPMLAAKTGLDSDILQRVMTFLCTQRVFVEVADDVFAHTHISATFARNPDLRAAAGSQLDEIFKAAPEMATSLKQFSESKGELARRTPFEERFGMPVFEYYKQHPKEAARFAAGMGAVTKCMSASLGPHLSPSNLVYPSGSPRGRVSKSVSMAQTGKSYAGRCGRRQRAYHFGSCSCKPSHTRKIYAHYPNV